MTSEEDKYYILYNENQKLKKTIEKLTNEQNKNKSLSPDAMLLYIIMRLGEIDDKIDKLSKPNDDIFK